MSKYDQNLDDYLQSSGIHKSERCKACGGPLAWESYTAPGPMTDSLVSLLENKHFMASTVILSAIVENAIQDLVWAGLVDKNIEYEQGNVVANSRMNRIDCLNLASALIGKIKLPEQSRHFSPKTMGSSGIPSKLLTRRTLQYTCTYLSDSSAYS